MQHNPEIVTVAFTDADIARIPDIHDNPASLLEIGAYVFDEHGCELGVFNILFCFSVDPAEHCYGPSAEHPDRDVLGWPEGIDMPASIYNGVDEAWACPNVDAAWDAAIYEAAEKAVIDAAYGEGLSWFAVNEMCEEEAAA